MKSHLIEFINRSLDPAHNFFDGHKLPVQIAHGEWKRSKIIIENDLETGIPEKFLLQLPQNISILGRRRMIEKLFDLFYKRQTKLWANEHLGLLQKYDYRPIKTVRIKKMRSRWGSCSKVGNLNFNRDLAKIPPQLRNYVFAHEYAHLQHLNHSRNFWNTVAKFDPNYDLHRRQIRQYEKLLIH